MDEVTAAIAKLKKGKTPGVCGIRAEMLENEERAVGSYHYVQYICTQLIIAMHIMLVAMYLGI